jgi:hypothetical protein
MEEKANLFLVLAVSLNGGSGRGLSVLSLLSGSNSDDSLVDSGLDAVVLLDVQLGQLVVLIDGCLLEISEGRGLDYVSNLVSLDGLVLGDGLGSGRASVRINFHSKMEKINKK